MRASKGTRRGTRRKLRRTKGKININRILTEFKVGDRVSIDLDPAFHKHMPHPRFQGSTGTVKSKKGNIYIIAVKTGGKTKTITASTAHLKPAGN